MAKQWFKTKKGDGSDAPERAVRDERAVAVEQAAGANEGPDSDEGTHAGAREVGVEFAGASGEEQLAELIAQTAGDAEGGEGSATDFFAKSKDERGYNEFIGGDGEDEGEAESFEDRLADKPDGYVPGMTSPGRASGSDGDDSGLSSGGSSESAFADELAKDPGVGANPLAGEEQPDPASSFIDAVATKTGRDFGMSSPDEEQNASPGAGERSVASEKNGITVTSGSETVGGTWDRDKESVFYKEVRSEHNGTVTRIRSDGTSTTWDLDGKVIDETSRLTNRNGWDSERHGASGVKDPRPDGEERVTPGEKADDPLFQDYLRMKNAGGGGDGTADPSEIEEGQVRDPSAQLPDQRELSVRMFGQPAGDEFGGDRDVASDAGYYNHANTGAIDPGDDQTMTGGPERNEDPADAMPGGAPVAGVPADESEEETETDEGGAAILPPSEIAGPVDAGALDPDDIDIVMPG